MSFACTFYNVSDDNNVLSKTLGNAKHTCESTVPYKQISPLTGQLLLDYDADILGSNYVHFLDKYHYIRDYTLLPGQKISITCEVDVLMTYKESIKSCVVFPKRSGAGSENSLVDNYIYDTKVPFEETYEHFNVPFDGNNLDYDGMCMICGIISNDYDLT